MKLGFTQGKAWGAIKSLGFHTLVFLRFFASHARRAALKTKHSWRRRRGEMVAATTTSTQELSSSDIFEELQTRLAEELDPLVRSANRVHAACLFHCDF